MRTMELARRIFAVRDCFKNIIQVSFSAGSESAIRRDQQSIPSLAEFCSMVIGSTIQDEFDEFSAKGRDDSDFMGEDEVLDIANGIYEAVPTHYRRCVISTIPFIIRRLTLSAGGRLYLMRYR